MLLEFSVGNYLSFRERKTLNLVASSISDYKETNTITSERHTLLKGAIIYGANASGKSNFIRAMSTMRRIVMSSFHQTSTKTLGIKPFLLSTETEKSPSSFEVLFEILGTRYRYGFEVTDKAVVGEWLYEAKKNVEKFLFLREGDGIEVAPSYKEAENLESKTRDNALFLSVIDQFNGVIAKRIMNWFNKFITISGLTHENYEMVTFKMLDEEKTAKTLGNFYDQLDLGFDGLSIEKEKFNLKRFPEDIPEALVKLMVKDLEGAFRFKIKTLHKKYNKNNKNIGDVEFDMRSQESAGTNKVFNISGPIFDVLQDGGVLVIDELDSSLHPLLTLAITKLFNSEKDNSKNAQLIFTTHDTNLFSYGNYRRDQIYFVEKDEYGVSDLYSLVEYREENGAKVRKDRSFESDYIQGRYGAIPYIGDISKIVEKWQEK
ncbi:MAG: ATP-binding protein [Bacteroidales bacterium]|jgi:AAA15 family ATPase/GTPase|nr:ATP-binding protein [Bacteroidales bacterium]MDY0313678.1 ATP-binding protein [Bacteroidales bacterium]NLB87523.1 ATP-binding protein [Bacteroidales bacterium]